MILPTPAVIALLVLLHRLLIAPHYHRIDSKAHVGALLGSLTIDLHEAPLSAPAEDVADPESDGESDDEYSADEHIERAASRLMGFVIGLLQILLALITLSPSAARSRLASLLFDSPPTLTEVEATIKAEVDEMLEQEHEAELEGRNASHMATMRDGVRRVLTPIGSLIADILGPIQKVVGDGLVVARVLQRTCIWDDRVLSLWVALAFALAAALLALLGYALSLLPWALIVEVIMRLAGVALFGPHMWWIGKRVEEAEAEHAARADAFARADAAERRRLTDEMRARYTAEARAALQAEQRSQDPKADGSLDAAASELQHDPCFFVTQSGVGAGRLKYHCRPQASRSIAYPMQAAHGYPPPGPPLCGPPEPVAPGAHPVAGGYTALVDDEEARSA
jgi:hypothetical protein